MCFFIQHFHSFFRLFYSSFNSTEVQMAFNYIKVILKTEKCRHQVKQKDIAVVTPYTLQAEKIREICSPFEDITIGPTEVLQGQEKQIVIVSTVAVDSLTEFVTNFRVFLKFVNNSHLYLSLIYI